jgi:hypothetical protein
MGWVQNALIARSARSRIATVRTFPVDVQRAIATDLAAFINMCGVSDGMLPVFLSAATEERRDALAAAASSRKDPRWVLAALKEDWCKAKLSKMRGVMSVAVADAVTDQIEGFAFGSGRRAFTGSATR